MKVLEDLLERVKVESKPVEGKLRKESKNKTTMVQEVNWVTDLESKSILFFFCSQIGRIPAG